MTLTSPWRKYIAKEYRVADEANTKTPNRDNYDMPLV